MERLKLMDYIQPPKSGEMNLALTNQVFFPFVTSIGNNVKFKYTSSVFSSAYSTFPILAAFLKTHRVGLFMFLCIWSTVGSGVIP